MWTPLSTHAVDNPSAHAARSAWERHALILSRELTLGTRPATSPPALRTREQGERAVILDNIRSAWNVGSIFRSADGFGFTHVYLCGITPTPENEAVTKTSLGAEDSVPWSYHKDAVKLVKGLKKEEMENPGVGRG